MKLTKPVKGRILYLTINRRVQLTAEQAILNQIATTRLITRPAGEILQAVQLTENVEYKGAAAGSPLYPPNYFIQPKQIYTIIHIIRYRFRRENKT